MKATTISTPGSYDCISINLARRKVLAVTSATALLMLSSACTTSMPMKETPEQQRATIDQGVDATLTKLYANVPGSQGLADKAQGILVFPKVYAAGLGVGGERGKGALRVANSSTNYYTVTAVTLGLQAGAESKALVMMFMTQEALDKFRNSKGWTAGADASVAVMKMGANGTIDTTSASSDVKAFALTNAGLMAAVTVDGTKFTKLML